MTKEGTKKEISAGEELKDHSCWKSANRRPAFITLSVTRNVVFNYIKSAPFF